jgi:hypothetical protein
MFFAIYKTYGAILAPKKHVLGESMGCAAARPLHVADPVDSPKELSVVDPSSDRSRATGLSDSPLECAMHKSLSSRKSASDRAPLPPDRERRTGSTFIGIVVPGAVPFARFDSVGLWWMFIAEAMRLDQPDLCTAGTEQRAFVAALLLRANLLRTQQMPHVVAPRHGSDSDMEHLVHEAARMAELRAAPDGWHAMMMIEIRAMLVDELTYHTDDPVTMPSGWTKKERITDETIFNRIHATSCITLVIPRSHTVLATDALATAMSDLAEWIAETASE